MKIDPRHILSLVLLLVVGYWLLPERGTSSSNPTIPSSVNARGAKTPVLHDEAAYQRELKTRIEELSRMEEQKERRERASSKTAAVRQELHLAKQHLWSEVLATNGPAFQALREKAKTSRNGETPCTICDGKGYMHFCLICANNSGVCVTCSGAGQIALNELCPTCLGTRKCYKCFGTGKMLCAFCNDGAISHRTPSPPRAMPVH